MRAMQSLKLAKAPERADGNRTNGWITWNILIQKMQLSASISVYLVFNKYGSENTTRTRLLAIPIAIGFDALQTVPSPNRYPYYVTSNSKEVF